jgi:hypothetical protein
MRMMGSARPRPPNHLPAASRRLPKPKPGPPSRRFAAARHTTSPALRAASPNANHLRAAAQRLAKPPHRSQRRCAADPGPTTHLLAASRRSIIILQNPALICGQRLFPFQKNLCFSSKTVFLGADLGTCIFMVFYHKNCSQPNPPILVSFSQQQKKEKKTKKRHFLNHRIN